VKGVRGSRKFFRGNFQGRKGVKVTPTTDLILTKVKGENQKPSLGNFSIPGFIPGEETEKL